MSLTDIELMMRVKNGSKSAFNILVKRYQKRLINFFYRNLWDRDLSEDLAQEVFIRLYRSAKNYVPHSKFTTFIYRIAKNLLIDYYRQKKSKPRPSSIFTPGSADDDNFKVLDTLPSDAKAPDAQMQSLELGEAIKKAIDDLPEDQKQVFILGELEGFAYQEISDILQIPIGTVKSRMHAAFMKLRVLLIDFAPHDDSKKRKKAKGEDV